jgi:SpoVK/Ycf46/Vps4 family AAA+-type ATPase
MDALTDRQRLVQLLRARHACIALVTAEEDHALNAVVGAALDVGRPVLVWSMVRGLCDGTFADDNHPLPETLLPAAALRSFARGGQARVLACLDLSEHLESEVVLRSWRETVDSCRRSGSTVVMIDHRDELPEVVAAGSLRFEVSLPDEHELMELAKEALRRLRAEERIAIDITAAQFSALVHNLRGLSRRQAEQVVRDAAIAADRLDAGAVKAVVALRRRMLHRQGVLDCIELPVELSEVAGVRQLKRWLALRAPVMAAGALPVAGLEPPRGILMLGVPGSGKSLCAKAIATAWGQPLLRLDAGALYDRYVGESERRLREALQQAESMAPVVLWIDEIEKAFASASSRSSDGGLSQRMFGSLLTWMQERRAPVFVVATANDIEALPPELLRKGRFDEIFFIDLPGLEVRHELLRIHLAKRGLEPAVFALDELAGLAAGRSGAELEQAIVAACYEAHAAGVAPGSAHLSAALQASAPLSVTMAESISALREWARTRCLDADREGGGEVAVPGGGRG